MRRILERIFNKYNDKGFFKFVSDDTCLKILYHLYFNKELMLSNPKTFNEKLQWLKLYDRNPAYTEMVDKEDVKGYIRDKIGKKYVIPTYGVWDNFEDIEWDLLPRQFVLKCTHDSGSIVICKDKEKLDIKSVRKKLTKGLQRNLFWTGREWPYKNVKPRIIAEEYLESEQNELPDYKIHCFNGDPRFILVCRNRFGSSGLTEDFFDIEWNHMSVKRPGHRFSNEQIQRPELLEEMIELSKVLSNKIPFLRVDFYLVRGKIYFGELTFYPASGFAEFEPESYDYQFGEWIELPSKE